MRTIIERGVGAEDEQRYEQAMDQLHAKHREHLAPIQERYRRFVAALT
jgi:hypothetical protein